MKDYPETVSMKASFTNTLGKEQVISLLQSLCTQRICSDVSIYFSGRPQYRYCLVWSYKHPTALGKWEFFGEAPIYSDPRWRRRLLAGEIEFEDLKGLKP